jgi:iron complex transport system substrate-binding protein
MRLSSTRPRNVVFLRRAAVSLALALVLAVPLLTAGCGGGSGSTSPSSPAAVPSTGPITASDDSGQQVTLSAPAERVVSIAPANTEIAFAIDAGSKLVAGTSYDDYPEAAKSLPKIGDFANPSVEKIVSFRPDLVLATGGIQAGLRGKLERLGIKVFVVDPMTLDAVYADMTALGRLLGVKSQADALVDSMKQRAATIQEKVSSAAKSSVFVEIYNKPLMTAGSGTLIDDLINKAGGANIGAGAGNGFPSFSTEVLLQKNPDVYIATTGAQQDPGQIAARAGYRGLKAVQDGRVYVVEDNLVVRAGPRLVDGLEQLASMIHPEIFGAPSPQPSGSTSQ